VFPYDAHMKERFKGAGLSNLINVLIRQEFIGGDRAIAERFAAVGKLVEYETGSSLIKEDAEDDDLYLLIAGSVAIVVKGMQVGTRSAGDHVGEMSAIEPSQRRSATVVAQEKVVALRTSSAELFQIGSDFPQIWLPIARVLARRLLQRNNQLSAPNESPRLFLISSAEALNVAYEVATQLERTALCTVWAHGTFFAGQYTLEALEHAVSQSDFAVAIAQPDDIVETRKTKRQTIRDNVVFELGLFMGHLTRHRAILLHPRVPDLKLPSDVNGLTLLSYADGKPEDLTARLTAPCHEIRKLIQRLGVRVRG